jgi:hypothetical protein
MLLTNQLGQTIKTIHLSSENNFQVTLSDLANGVYILNAEQNTPQIRKKIIILEAE